MQRIERRIDHEVRARFPDGAVRRVVLLQHGDDPVIEPGEFLVRVFIGASGSSERGPGGAVGPEDDQQTLAAWEQAHRARMERLRRELSLRLPMATLLEFTVERPGESRGSGAAVPRITMRHDPALATERMPPREIVPTALSLLRARYVFPERAAQAATAIEARLAAGEYDDLDEITLAERLTSQLYEICADKHLRVKLVGPRRHEPAGPGVPAGSAGPGEHPAPGPPGPDGRGGPAGPGQLDNFGIHRVERLDGNIGYLDLHRVPNPANAGRAIAAAMELVSGTYALIIDLRRNGGGSPDGVVFWCSYLFPDGDVHLNDIYEAESGLTRQFWSLAYVPGERYLDRPVYVLTSHRTFSGGEDFCYTLQAQGRAEVIGETTGGGAHPTAVLPISSSVAIAVPFARSINPVTGTNWEGTGVVPDVAAGESEAYDLAYGKALRHVLAAGAPGPIAHEARAALDRLPGPASAAGI